jgi:ATP-binding cassette, subfamily C, bacterial CydC
MIKKLIGYIAPHKRQFAMALLIACGTILAGIGLMTTSGYLISRAAQRPLIVDLFMVTAGVRFFGVSRAVIRYFERIVSHDLTFKILHSMRNHLYRKFDSFSQRWLMGNRPGDLLSGIVTDIETLQNVYLRIISPVVVAVIISVLTFWGLTLFNTTLAFSTLGFLAINGILVPLITARIACGRGIKEIATRTTMKVFLVDRIQGLQDLIWLGQKKNTTGEFDSMQNSLNEIQSKNAGTSGMAEGLNTLLSHLAMFTVLVLAIPLVLNGEIKGVWLAAITLGVLTSFEAVQGLANAFIQYENSTEAANHLFSLSEEESSTAGLSQKNANILINKPANIIFKDVSFSYNVENITLENISFAIPEGSKTAIIGPTGSGKSTLINLLLGLWHPDGGEILVNHTNLRNVDLEIFRSKLGVVAQDSYIFNRSLRENLLISNPEATDEELTEALDKVGLSTFAHSLDMEPGTHGMRFSGGERQLFSLARVLLKKSDVWVFDELTAHMDVNTERKTLNTIWNHLGSKTLILITHRLVNMEKMDQIIIMQKGKIAETGTHAGLLSQNGIYAKMRLQQNELIRD